MHRCMLCVCVCMCVCVCNVTYAWVHDLCVCVCACKVTYALVHDLLFYTPTPVICLNRLSAIIKVHYYLNMYKINFLTSDSLPDLALAFLTSLPFFNAPASSFLADSSFFTKKRRRCPSPSSPPSLVVGLRASGLEE